MNKLKIISRQNLSISKNYILYIGLSIYYSDINFFYSYYMYKIDMD